MKGLLLHSFYDSMQYSTGWIISYVFMFFMTIELLYVMYHYLLPHKRKGKK
ncbi:MAG TPA: hypothetical protein PLQ78_01730 [Flavipsychrobacter sp.]|nr:hypothetical protein [Flavipsychrobacter sp.]